MKYNNTLEYINLKHSNLNKNHPPHVKQNLYKETCK